MTRGEAVLEPVLTVRSHAELDAMQVLAGELRLLDERRDAEATAQAVLARGLTLDSHASSGPLLVAHDRHREWLAGELRSAGHRVAEQQGAVTRAQSLVMEATTARELVERVQTRRRAAADARTARAEQQRLDEAGAIRHARSRSGR